MLVDEVDDVDVDADDGGVGSGEDDTDDVEDDGRETMSLAAARRRGIAATAREAVGDADGEAAGDGGTAGAGASVTLAPLPGDGAAVVDKYRSVGGRALATSLSYPIIKSMVVSLSLAPANTRLASKPVTSCWL